MGSNYVAVEVRDVLCARDIFPGIYIITLDQHEKFTRNSLSPLLADIVHFDTLRTTVSLTILKRVY